MNELQQHIDYVQHFPNDKAGALALVDHIRENNGDDQRAALREVGRIRRDERNRRDVMVANGLFTELNEHQEELISQTIEAAEGDTHGNAAILVVNGSRPPRAISTTEETEWGEWRQTVVHVGARWVIRRNNIIGNLHNAMITEIEFHDENGNVIG